MLTVRLARESDLDDIEEMVNDFAKGHPAQSQPRSRSKLNAAYFGETPVARLVVACRNGRAIGMGQWTLVYDMFWGFYGANADWLYVRPQHRGSGVFLALAAGICAQAREAGAEFLRGGADAETERLYERVAIGHPARECHVSAKAFQELADLAGLSPREIAQRLPGPELNKVARPSRP